MKAVLELTQVLPHGTNAEWTEPFTLDVPRGTWTVIRTTPERSHRLARTIVGTEDCSGGEVIVRGESIARLTRTARRSLLATLGVLLDPAGLMSNLTLADNLIVPSVFRGTKGKVVARAAVMQLFASMGIAEHADRRPSDVPEDARQLGALARAMVGEPQLLILENPIAAVRSRAAADIWRFCRDLVPTAIVTTFRRDEMLYDVANDLYLWDSAGLRRASVGSAA